jgi:hypothetical protein
MEYPTPTPSPKYIPQSPQPPVSSHRQLSNDLESQGTQAIHGTVGEHQESLTTTYPLTKDNTPIEPAQESLKPPEENPDLSINPRLYNLRSYYSKGGQKVYKEKAPYKKPFGSRRKKQRKGKAKQFLRESTDLVITNPHLSLATKSFQDILSVPLEHWSLKQACQCSAIVDYLLTVLEKWDNSNVS